MLDMIARVGIQVEIQTGGDLPEYSNQRSAANGGEMLMKATPNVALNRAILLPATRTKEIVGVHISLVEAIKDKGKLGVIQNYACSAGEDKGEEGSGIDSGDRR